MADFSSPRVLCRRAIARDKADVLAFTRFIWEGHDYIQYVWDDWFMDPHGRLAVAEYAGRAVALGKLTRISPGQWWLEGLRVDPQYQGLKIGSHMHEYLQDWWSEHEGGTIRLMTSWERVQVHHLCERFGWAKIAEVRSYSAVPLPGQPDRLELVPVAAAPRAAEFARDLLIPYGGLMDSGWQFSAPDERVLHDLAQQKRLWWWRADEDENLPSGLLACWEDEEEEGKRLGIAFAAVSADRLTDLLSDARRLAKRLGYDRALWLAPALPFVEAPLQQAGYETDWDGTAYIYEKRQSIQD